MKLAFTVEALDQFGRAIEAPLREDLADQQVEETRAALRGLGLDDNVDTK